MKSIVMIVTLAAIASAIGFVSYSQSRAPGADIRNLKTSDQPPPRPFVKDQSRILPEE